MYTHAQKSERSEKFDSDKDSEEKRSRKNAKKEEGGDESDSKEDDKEEEEEENDIPSEYFTERRTVKKGNDLDDATNRMESGEHDLGSEGEVTTEQSLEDSDENEGNTTESDEEGDYNKKKRIELDGPSEFRRSEKRDGHAGAIAGLVDVMSGPAPMEQKEKAVKKLADITGVSLEKMADGENEGDQDMPTTTSAEPFLTAAGCT